MRRSVPHEVPEDEFVLEARYRSSCSNCPRDLEPGQLIQVDTTGRAWRHVKCAPKWRGLVGLVLLGAAFVLVVLACTGVLTANAAAPGGSGVRPTPAPSPQEAPYVEPLPPAPQPAW